MSQQQRINALGDIAILIGIYLNQNIGLIDIADCWNPAGFISSKINSQFGWSFKNLPKPTLVQLEALKAQLG